MPRLAVLLLLSSLSLVRSPAAEPRPPNIVVIIADDLGWSGIAPYGNQHLDTPHLAREGMRVDRADAEPQCSPMRGAFFSGRWPARTGMFAVTHEMDPVAAPLVPPPHAMALTPEVASLALMLRGAGYTNGLSGKWHIADNYSAAPLRARDGGKYFDRYGFDFVGEAANAVPKDKSVAGITDDMLSFIERHRARPFFAFVAHHAPHAVLEPPAALVEKYVARGLRRSSTPLTVFRERPTADYYATLEHLDTHLGRILALLDRLDLAKDTLVIFTSDNGGLNRMADMAPLRGSKGQTYEGGIRVPLLARWPARIAAGSSNSVPVHVVDWYPTFAALAGAKPDAARQLDGENLVPLLTGGDFDLADLATDGYEVNFTGNITPVWRVIVNVSKTESVQTNMLKRSRAAAAVAVPLWRNPAAQSLQTTAGVSVAQEILNYQNWLAATTAVENTGTVGHRELEARAFTRYDFTTGRLKGAFIGGGLSYGSAPVIGRSTTGTLFTASIRREADALLGYRTRLPQWLGRAGVELQLNANNLLQQKDYTLVRRDPDGQLFRAAVNPPTSYALSARFSF